MSAEAAEVIAAHTDWSQFATKHDLSQLESRLIRWMVGIFLTFLGLLGGLAAVVTAMVTVFS